MTPKYAFPPLREVAFEVNFLPKLKILKQIDSFQEAISRDYPLVGEERSKIEGMETRDSNSLDTTVKYRFESEDRGKIVRIHVAGFNVVTTDYDSFATFSEEIGDLWSKFEGVVGECLKRRIGLRYVNELLLPYRDGERDLSHYVRLYHDDSVVETESLASLRLEARVKAADSMITVRTGLLGDRKEESGLHSVYMLDYDCYVQDEQFDGSVSDILHRCHQVIEERFQADTEQPYKDFMETGQWGT